MNYKIIFLLLILSSFPIYSNSVISYEYNLIQNTEILIDKTNILTLEDIKLLDEGFHEIDGPDFLYTDHGINVWLKMQIPVEVINSDRDFIIEFGRYFISDLYILDIFFPVGNDKYLTIKRGFSESQGNSSEKSINILIDIPPDITDHYVYIKTRNPTVYMEPVTLWDLQNFCKKRILRVMPVLLLFGLLVGMVLYNICIFFFLKEKTYIVYVIYILFLFLWQFYTLGYGKLLVSISSMSYISLFYLFSKLAIFGCVIFVMLFLDTKQWVPKIQKIIYAIIIAIVCSTILSFFKLYSISDIIDNVTGIVSSICIFIIIIIRCRQKFIPAKIVLIAWTLMGIFTTLFFLRSLQIIPNSFLSVYAILIGASIESILLSLALAFKIRLLKRESGQFKELSEKDALTNLLNKRYLLIELPLIIKSSKMSDSVICVMMIDVDDFKVFNDSHGHLQGDIMLQKLAKVLKNTIRCNDVACRYGGEEFSVILNDINLFNAEIIANRIIDVFSKTTLIINNVKVSSTVSIGLTELKNNDNAQSILNRADSALYKAKKAGKNRVVIGK